MLVGVNGAGALVVHKSSLPARNAMPLARGGAMTERAAERALVCLLPVHKALGERVADVLTTGAAVRTIVSRAPRYLAMRGGDSISTSTSTSTSTRHRRRVKGVKGGESQENLVRASTPVS